MRISTLGEAWRLGWRVKARCLRFAPAPKSRHDRTLVACDTTVELDMVTLIWTRGERMPLSLLQERLRCPRCGNRAIQSSSTSRTSQKPAKPHSRVFIYSRSSIQAPPCG